MRGCCGCLALILLVVVLIGAAVFGAAAYAGLVPLVSPAIGASQPRDLGVRWTDADYQSAVAKLNIEMSSPETACLTCPTVYEGTQTVSAQFTDRELSALLSLQNAAYGPLRDAQVKFSADGTGEVSLGLRAFVSAPVYARGKLARQGPRQILFELDQVEIGRLPLPGPVVSLVSTEVDRLVNAQLATVDGLDIQQLQIGAGTLSFRGSLPQAARGSPPE